MRIEDRYPDVLQNIELGIVNTYRKNPDMSDYDVIRMLEALQGSYVAEKIGRTPRKFSLSELEQSFMDYVRQFCEWRLGRPHTLSFNDEYEDTVFDPRTVDEILLCLKRILKSVKKWNKLNGRQGYLNFVVQFVQ